MPGGRRGLGGMETGRGGRGAPPRPASAPGRLINQPAQAAAAVYGATGTVNAAQAYAFPGALVVTGLGNYNDQVFHDISTAGGTVLLYLDVVVVNTAGRYADMLFNSSACGGAVGQWPPGYEVIAGSGVFLADFRPGGTLQNKLSCVLETMVSENPHIGGFFLDELGTRSFYSGVDWPNFPDQQAYRDGAIAVAQTARNVCDEHGLIFLVNGTWQGGTLAVQGGGYPDISQHGCSLADGGVAEHHDTEIAFWGPYAASAQWASGSGVTNGVSFMWAIMNTTAGVDEFVNDGHYAYVNYQPSASYDYIAPYVTLTHFHPTGLPWHVVR